MPNDLTISFIGGGTMAEAILAAVLGKGLVDSSAIVVGEPIARTRSLTFFKQLLKSSVQRPSTGSI